MEQAFIVHFIDAISISRLPVPLLLNLPHLNIQLNDIQAI